MKPFARSHLAKNALVFSLIIVIIWYIAQLATVRNIYPSIPTGAKNAADFFIENQIKGPIFNNFDIGSYLDYRLFPNQRVFVDGRPEAYPASFFQEEYIPMQENPFIFKEKVKKYHINTIFFAHTDQTPWAEKFLKQITNSPDWIMIYLYYYFFILTKNTPQNLSLIQKFGMKKGKLQISSYQPKNFQSLLQLAHLFAIIDEKQQAIKVFQDILAINPSFCPALYNLSILTRDQVAIANSYGNQFLTHCQ